MFCCSMRWSLNMLFALGLLPFKNDWSWFYYLRIESTAFFVWATVKETETLYLKQFQFSEHYYVGNKCKCRSHTKWTKFFIGIEEGRLHTRKKERSKILVVHHKCSILEKPFSMKIKNLISERYSNCLIAQMNWHVIVFQN